MVDNIVNKLRERGDELSIEAADLIQEIMTRYRKSTEPLREEEIALLKENGWKFLHPYYIYIPDDYDGCMAEGLYNIRNVVEGIRKKEKDEMSEMR